MSIAVASLSETPIADATVQAAKKVPRKRLTVVPATTVLVPEPR